MTSGFWRVWREEDVVVYSSDSDGEAGREECARKLASLGLAHAEWRAEPWNRNDPGGWPWCLVVRIPVLKGEFRDRDDAVRLAAEIRGTTALEGSDLDSRLAAEAMAG